MSIQDAHRALVEARTAAEHELADVTARLARIDAAITALEPDTATPPAAPAAAAPPGPAKRAASPAPRQKPSTPKQQATAQGAVTTKQRGRVAKCGTESGHSAHCRRGEVPCSECRSAHSAAVRERKARKEGAATPTPAQASAAPSNGPKAYRCTECDFEAASAKDMAHHTITRHKRGPALEERTAA